MPEVQKLQNPWLIAVWPGMGHVAINAGYYLLSKLGMHGIAEFESKELFDVDHVLIKAGLIQPGRRPRNRLFQWVDPQKKRDLVLFLGEAQPPLGKYSFCEKLVEFSKQMGVERIYTFAAMATAMHPTHPSRVFAAATDADRLEELKRLELLILQDGHIGGLNGVLLGAASQAGLSGGCLLGEIPHIFNQLPFPKASRAILEVFAKMTGLELDFTDLDEQARVMEEQMGDILQRMQQQMGIQLPQPEDGPEPASTPEKPSIATEERDRIEELFTSAEEDRSKAFELKQELDRLSVFKEYEDRFLDLFRHPE